MILDHYKLRALTLRIRAAGKGTRFSPGVPLRLNILETPR
jgi:hypothetical protein